MNRHDIDINYLTYKLEKVYFLLDQYISNHGKELTHQQYVALRKCFVPDSVSYEEYKLGKHADGPYREPFAEDPE